jgi:D-inositol-3-phosphate glycosyltransferase
LRILFVSHYALPHVGGIEVAIDAVASELTRRGHAVTHLAAAARRDHEEESGPRPYRVLRLPALNTLEDRTGAPWPVFGPGLVGTLKRELAKTDVVHAHGFLYMSSLAALLLAPRARVLTEHVGHVRYESKLLDRGEAVAIATLGRLAARRADALVYLSDKVAGELRGLAPDTRLVRIANGVDTEWFHPPREGERAQLRSELGWDERPRVLFVGRLVAKKGVDVALSAAAANGGFELVLVGPGDPPASVPGGATVLGPLPRERVAELYRAADAFLLPSRGEGFPLTAQEAMASGLPVVLADDPAYEPHLDGAGDGAHTRPPDGEELAALLNEIVADPERRERAGAQAAEHARRAFSWEAVTDAHERLYSELLAGRTTS